MLNIPVSYRKGEEVQHFFFLHLHLQHKKVERKSHSLSVSAEVKSPPPSVPTRPDLLHLLQRG